MSSVIARSAIKDTIDFCQPLASISGVSVVTDYGNGRKNDFMVVSNALRLQQVSKISSCYGDYFLFLVHSILHLTNMFLLFHFALSGFDQSCLERYQVYRRRKSDLYSNSTDHHD